ncbi:MAG: hypothetical protein V1747_11220 [Candidatus Omnitrophota bacterium]
MAEFDFKQNKNRPRKQFKYSDAPERHQEESDVPTMLRKIQQQLVFLERKIDLLSGQSPARPPRAEGHSGGFGSRPRDASFGERSSYQGKKPFTPRSGTRADKPGEKSFFKGKKSFSSKKRSRP